MGNSCPLSKESILSELPDSDNLFKIASSIKLPHELSNQPRAFEMANAALGNMKKIYFLGFGYHSDLLQRYMPAFEGSDKQIYGTAMGLSRGERSAIFSRYESGFNVYEGLDPMQNKHGRVTLGSPDQNCLSFFRRTFMIEVIRQHGDSQA